MSSTSRALAFIRNAPGAMVRIFNRLSKPEDPGSWLISTGGVKIPGVYINNWRQAMQSPTVWRGVNLVAASVAMLPWHVLKSKAPGQAERVPPDHPIQWLLHNEPNPETTAFDFRRTIMTHAIGQGNGYAEIERNGRGQPVALWLVDDPDRVTPARTKPGGQLVYEIQNAGGERVVLPARDVFHVRGLATDGVVGLGILDVAKRTVQLNIALDIMEQKYFQQGMKTPGFIKTKGKMNLDGLKAVIKLIKEEFSGLENFEMPIPLDQDMEWQQAGSNMRDAQFIEIRREAVLDLCRVLGVPPHKVYDLTRATFSNIEHQDHEFIRDGILPRVVPMEQEANRKLLSSNFGGLQSKFNLNGFARADMQSRGAFYKIMREVGAFTVNDILALEDMPTIGEEGDVRVMQSQYQPIEFLLEPPPEPAPAAPGGGMAPGEGMEGEEDEPPPAPPPTRGRRNRKTTKHVNGDAR